MGEERKRLSPLAASALGMEPTLRTLVQGYSGIGKTTTVIESAVRAFGYGYAINCGTRTALQPALRETGAGKWDFNHIDYEDYFEDQFEDCIANAREGAKSGKYKWIVVDDYNLYATQLEGAYINEDSQKDFNRWRTYCRRVMNAINRLFACDAHVIVTCHVTDWKSTQLQGQNKKDGSGFVNSFPGQLRAELPGLFAEKTVLKFDEEKDGERVLLVNEAGVYGVACRTIGQDVSKLPADMGLLQKEVEKWGLSKGGKGSSPPTKVSSPKSAAPVRPAPATQTSNRNNQPRR